MNQNLIALAFHRSIRFIYRALVLLIPASCGWFSIQISNCFTRVHATEKSSNAESIKIYHKHQIGDFFSIQKSFRNVSRAKQMDALWMLIFPSRSTTRKNLKINISVCAQFMSLIRSSLRWHKAKWMQFEECFLQTLETLE